MPGPTLSLLKLTSVEAEPGTIRLSLFVFAAFAFACMPWLAYWLQMHVHLRERAFCRIQAALSQLIAGCFQPGFQARPGRSTPPKSLQRLVSGSWRDAS